MKIFLLPLVTVIFAGQFQVDAGSIPAIGVRCHPTFTDVCIGYYNIFYPSPPSYEGFYGNRWVFLNPEAPVDELQSPGDASNNIEENLSPLVSVTVEESTVDGTCTVSINQEECSTCTPCGDRRDHEPLYDRYSADCTNVESTARGNGRMVECEEISPFFYPLEVAETNHSATQVFESQGVGSSSGGFSSVVVTTTKWRTVVWIASSSALALALFSF